MSILKNVEAELSIVVVGSFTPTIFNPDWLLRHGLLSEEDVEKDVKVEAIVPEVSRFSLPWCQLEIVASRLVVRTDKKGYFDVARDLVVGILSVLSETPVKGIGLNWTFVEAGDDREVLDRFGDLLAPKGPWEQVLPQSPRHGLLQLNIQSERSDGVPGSINTHIRPVPLEDEEHNDGIEIQVNNHFSFAAIREQRPEITAGEVILEYWDDSANLAEELRSNLVALASEG